MSLFSNYIEGGQDEVITREARINYIATTQIDIVSATLNLESSTGINIGANADTQTIAIGTGAVANTVTIGNTTSTTGVTLAAGSGGVAVTGNSYFSQSPGRIYLEEFFKRMPRINADILSATEATREIASPDFEILGTNSSNDDVTFSATRSGVQLQTDGADEDQVIIRPHLDANQSAWAQVLWGTENSVIWECGLVTDASVADIRIQAGLSLTLPSPIALGTDADQAFFFFNTAAATDPTLWHTVYSIAGTDTDAGVGSAVAVNTAYRLKIAIDSSRVARFYLNESLVTTSTALTNDIDLIPFVAVEADAAAAKTIHLCYEKISRIMFE